MYQKILVPVSAKHSGARANKALVHAAKICTGEIVLLHVANPVSNFVGGEARKAREQEMEIEGLTLLAPMLEELDKAGIRHRTRVKAGMVTEVIVNVAQEEKADLIVMFTDGRDSLKDLLFGSITERVLYMTDLPVLVVRR